jgi:DNA ligase-1
MKDFKPMLAAKTAPSPIVLPIYFSPKLDGIRATVVGGQLITRTKKPVPNKYIRSLLSNRKFEGMDGELIVGSPTAPDCYRVSNSGVMSHNGQPDFTFWVFDRVPFDRPDLQFKQRYQALRSEDWNPAERARLLPQQLIESADQLEVAEQAAVDAGYEGGIGRSLERFHDSECQIVSIEEEMHNTNAAETNELGRTKRSTAKAGLVGKGTMGALCVRDIYSGVSFKIGTGFTAAQRAQPWKIGSVHKYKFFPVGVKDKPRHPVYIGPRSKLDL